jgi:hypothetical protein
LHLRSLQAAESSELTWSPGDDFDKSDVQAKLRAMCLQPCVFQLSYTTKDATIPLLGMLHSLGLATDGQALAELYLNPRDDGDVRALTGRLPPALIQRVVREHFGVFRSCYEAGLGRNSELTGRVTVRFVISREGLVVSAKDGGSDLPDIQVRDCVINSFLKLQFPKPDGGIVTVVYPILLAPG